MKNFFDLLIRAYGKTNAAYFLLVKTALMVSYIVRVHGVTTPLIAITNSSQIKKSILLKILSGTKVYSEVSLDCDKEELEKALNDDKEVTFFTDIRGKKKDRNLSLLKSICISGKVTDSELYTLPVILCDSVMSDNLSNILDGRILLPDVYGVNLRIDDDLCFEAARELIEFIEIRYKALKLGRNEQFQAEECTVPDGVELFTYARDILVLYWKIYYDEEAQEATALFNKALSAITEKWYGVDDGIDWLQSIRRTLRKLSSTFHGVINMNDFHESERTYLDTALSYNDEYYALTKEQYQQICYKLSTIGIHEISKSLVNSKIMVRENTNRPDYTKNIQWRFDEEVVEIQRRYLFKRSVLDEVGHLTIEELARANQCERNEKLSLTLGSVEGLDRCLKVSNKTENYHMLTSGIPGVGKTVANELIIKQLAADGGIVIVFNFLQSFESWDVKIEKKTYHLKEEGVPLRLFLENGIASASISADRICQFFEMYEPMGAEQKKRMKEACWMVGKNIHPESNEIIKLFDNLADDDIGNQLIEKYSSLVTDLMFQGSDMLNDDTAVKVLDFSGFGGESELRYVGMLLFLIWDYYSKAKANRPCWIVLDEIPELDESGLMMLDKILRLGRKFQLSVLMISQSIKNLPLKIRRTIMQASTKLYFKPAESDVEYLAETIVNMKKKDAVSILSNLKKGECLATGWFDVTEAKGPRALKIHFDLKEEELDEQVI